MRSTSPWDVFAVSIVRWALVLFWLRRQSDVGCHRTTGTYSISCFVWRVVLLVAWLSQLSWREDQLKRLGSVPS